MLLSVGASLVAWIVIPLVALQWSPSVIASGSMQPTIDVGDVVVVRPVGRSPLGVETVVLYDAGPPTGNVVHRVVGRQRDGAYRTQGDANPTPDSEPVREEQIRGAAVLLVPWIGRPAVWAMEGRYPVLVAGGLGMLVCLRLSLFAFDPAYDPWAGRRHRLPITVMAGAGRWRPRQPGEPPLHLEPARLLPEYVDHVVKEGLRRQSAAGHRRFNELCRGSAGTGGPV